MATLYVVSTPIGNLGDVTHRAIDVLARVSRVLAEDTRHTAILFRRYGIDTPRVSLHEHNEAARIDAVVGWLEAGEDVALVSDAGTPLISDPGSRLVGAVLEAGHEVVPIPGASALLAALVASGLPVDRFAFFGFAPRKGRERQLWLDEVAALALTAIVYEAPARVSRLLDDLLARCDPSRRVVVAREMTKVHETFFRGTLAEAAAYYENVRVRGEVVLVLAGRATSEPAVTESAALAARLVAEGQRPSAVARELARRLGLARNEAYEIALAAAAKGEGEPS